MRGVCNCRAAQSITGGAEAPKADKVGCGRRAKSGVATWTQLEWVIHTCIQLKLSYPANEWIFLQRD